MSTSRRSRTSPSNDRTCRCTIVASSSSQNSRSKCRCTTQLVSAGEGTVVDRLFLPPERGRGRKLYGLHVRGASMEPLINDGDIVVVDPELVPVAGDVVVAIVDGEGFVKRLEQKRDHMVLAGNNGKVLQLDSAHVVGKVIQVIRNLP